MSHDLTMMMAHLESELKEQITEVLLDKMIEDMRDKLREEAKKEVEKLTTHKIKQWRDIQRMQDTIKVIHEWR